LLPKPPNDERAAALTTRTRRSCFWVRSLREKSEESARDANVRRIDILGPVKRTVCFLLALAATVMPIASAQSQRFALGIVRLDGRLVPFGAFDGVRWERAWPPADERVATPESIDNVDSVWRRQRRRVPRIWHAWPATAASPGEIRITGVKVDEAQCVDQIALTTDLPAAKDEHPDRVAIDADIPIGAIEDVSESDAVWKTARGLVLADFGRLEASAAQAEHQQLPRESPAPVVRLVSLYHERNSTRSPLYFVAERKYRPNLSPEDRDCERRTVMTGWLVPAADGTLQRRNARIFLTDCDRVNVRTALPLGALHVSHRLFWVLEEHGYEDQTYVIAEIEPTRVRVPLVVFAGGC